MRRDSFLLHSEGPGGERDAAATVVSSVEGAKVTLGERDVYTVRATGDNEYRVAQGERFWRVMCVSDGQMQWVFLDGEVYVVEVRARGGERRRTAASALGLAAPMPATVIKVLATAGDKVQRGDTLLVLEAMKMELPVRAPTDGVVKRVNCAQGRLVQPGVPLVEME